MFRFVFIKHERKFPAGTEVVPSMTSWKLKSKKEGELHKGEGQGLRQEIHFRLQREKIFKILVTIRTAAVVSGQSSTLI